MTGVIVVGISMVRHPLPTLLLLILPCLLSAAYPRAIHVFVALCDNESQGIVPVPSFLGDGRRPESNLYWGAMYGVQAYFDRQEAWQRVPVEESDDERILQRRLYYNEHEDAYLLADAYDGREIKGCIEDFLSACSGAGVLELTALGVPHFGGCADVLAYVGHDGLMEFSIDEDYSPMDDAERQAIVLACVSQPLFASYMKKTGALPLLWTTGLMAPEAYTLEAALSSWLKGGEAENVRSAAASAYAAYQKCSYNAARRLLVTGWADD